MFDGRPIVDCVEREKVGNNTTLQAHETCPSMPDTLNIWSLESEQDSFLRAYHLKSSGLGAR